MAGMNKFRGPAAGEDTRDKAVRSVFVANIAFETTEDQLRVVLAEVGPIVNLKMIYDPGTGKPRGFGFCEYEDGETAMSAVRNLAGRELNGRPLRIDSATNAPGGDGLRSSAPARPSGAVPGGSIEPPLYGAAVSPETAPEVITKAVASLPPEQMFELMKQMKWMLQHSPSEARQLLLHNPQLAYALLQAQVVMKIVDLEAAQNILHRSSRGPPLQQPDQRGTGPTPAPQHAGSGGPHPPGIRDDPRGPGIRDDPRGPPHPSGFRDNPRGPPHPREDPRGPPPRGGGDPSHYGGQREGFGPPHGRERERFGGPPPPPHFSQQRGAPPPTQRHVGYGGPGEGRGGGHRRSPGPPPPPSSSSSGSSSQEGLSPHDQERAALIMQVLSLSDEQIQLLPPDQRNSILQLKEQIARTGR